MSLDKERIAVLIGKNGETKLLIEEKTGTKILIDSKSGEFKIEAAPNFQSKDSSEEVDAPEVRIFATKQIIQAISYGFNPIKAFKLLEPEYVFDLTDLEDVLGHSEKNLTRIRGRLIGEEGKIRNAIEQFSGVSMSIYKKYLSLIGTFEDTKIAKKAINMIIQGAPHKAVLDYLQKEHEIKKKEDFKSLWKPTL